jgi:glycolate oxidase iron-sulfur subunit
MATDKTTAQMNFESMLMNCVHCGLCLQHCPTYVRSGDENDSPRGRLQIIRAIAEKRVPDNATSDYYMDECVGCMACMSACPSNVPYEHILLTKKAERVRAGKAVDWRIQLGATLAKNPRLFNLAASPIRLLRSLGLSPHPLLVPGKPGLFSTTAALAEHLNREVSTSAPAVGFFTGCLMDAVYREINAATVSVLSKLGYRVIVPGNQTCCGALMEHAGLTDKQDCDAINERAFIGFTIDCILVNSSGCGLSLKKGIKQPVEDVLLYIADDTLSPRARLSADYLYVDEPCHLVHGQKQHIPESLLNALGLPWSLAPMSQDCCGAGGSYNITHADHADEIIARKLAFLHDSPHQKIILATSNHICMQQWQKGLRMAGLDKRVRVAHVIQLLDECL